MTAFETPYHPKQEADVKSEPHSPSAFQPIVLPPIRTLTGDIDMRRFSTHSLASTSGSSYLSTAPPSPVLPIGNLDLYERNRRTLERLQQVSDHVQPSPNSTAYPSPAPCSTACSPYPSPERSLSITDHVVEKSKGKAKARSRRGVARVNKSTKDSAYKAFREKKNRKVLSLAQGEGWEECLKWNPNMEAEGVQRDGKRGLNHLKSNNIDRDIEAAGLPTLYVNKEHCQNTQTLIMRQSRHLHLKEIELHRRAGRMGDAARLEHDMRYIGTYNDLPRQSIWEAIPGLEAKMMEECGIEPSSFL